MEGVEIRPLARKADPRGWLVKMLMRQHLPEGQREFGEIYISVSLHGAIKANHYHQQTTEWFCPLGGRGLLTLLHLNSGERQVIEMDAEKPVCVTIPPRVAHAMQGVGDQPFYLLAYADVPYDPAKPDTIPYQVIV